MISPCGVSRKVKLKSRRRDDDADADILWPMNCNQLTQPFLPRNHVSYIKKIVPVEKCGYDDDDDGR